MKSHHKLRSSEWYSKVKSPQSSKIFTFNFQLLNNFPEILVKLKQTNKFKLIQPVIEIPTGSKHMLKTIMFNYLQNNLFSSF